MLKDVKAGQFDQKFLLEANRAAKDGKITRQELQDLGAAANADGTISAEELSLIAQLDRPATQSALAAAVEGKGSAFKHYEFDQQVAFRLDSQDDSLLVEGEEIKVSAALAGPVSSDSADNHGDAAQDAVTDAELRDAGSHDDTPGRPRLKLVLGRRADQVRENLSARAAGRDDKSTFLANVGINNLTRSTGKNAGSVAELIQQALAADKHERVDLSSLASLDPQQGLNMTYSLLVAKTSKLANSAHKNERIELRKEIKGFDQVLRDLGKGKTPDQEGIRQLNAFGLDVEDGKLINRASAATVTAEELADLRATTRSILQAFDSINILDENKLVKQVFSQFDVSEDTIDRLEATRAEYVESETSLHQDKDQVDDRAASVEEQTATVARQEEEIKQKGELFGLLESLFQGRDGISQLDNLQTLLAGFKPKQLESLNQLLSKYGLELRVDAASKRVSFYSQGKQVSGGEFFLGIQRSLGGLRKEFEQLKQGLVAAKAELSQRKMLLDQAIVKLEGSRSRFLSASQNYDAAMSQTDQEMSKLIALYDDPQTRALLNPEQLSRIEALKARYQRARGSYQSDLSRRQPLLQAVDQSLSRARKASDKAAAAIESATRTLAELNRLMDRLDSLMGQLEQLSATPGDASAAEQIAAANALEGQLNLMPRPMYVGIEKLAEELRSLMEQTRAQFDRLGKARESDARQAMRLSGEHLAKARKELDYHLDRLRQLDGHSKEALAKLLKDSLSAYKNLVKD